MTASLFAPPKFQPLDATGALMPASYVQFYLSESTTPTDVYADADLDTPLANPVVADSDGVFPFIYMDGAVTYRIQFYDGDDQLVWDCDPYAPPRDYPGGTVLMFMGTAMQLEAAYPSALWQVCDGTNSSYDLRGKFPIGVSSDIDPGEAVGSTPGTVTTSSNGAHTHTGATGSTTLTEAQLAAHFHQLAVNVEDSNTALVSASLSMQRGSNAGTGEEYRLRGVATTPTVAPSAPAGGGTGHDHTISSDGTHTHTVAGTLPPAVGVWFVMRRF